MRFDDGGGVAVGADAERVLACDLHQVAGFVKKSRNGSVIHGADSIFNARARRVSGTFHPAQGIHTEAAGVEIAASRVARAAFFDKAMAAIWASLI